jgi:hypothetical protein
MDGDDMNRIRKIVARLTGIYLFSLSVKLGYEYLVYTVNGIGIQLQLVDFIPGMILGGFLLVDLWFSLRFKLTRNGLRGAWAGQPNREQPSRNRPGTLQLHLNRAKTMVRRR